MKRYTILLSPFLLAGCESVPLVNEFDTVHRIINYDTVYSDKNAPMGDFSCMEILGDILIMGDTDDDNYFSFIDLQNGKLITKWGRKGRGPNEYVQIASRFSVKNSELVFLDSNDREINRVSISDIFDQDHNIEVKKEKYPYTISFRPRDIYPIGDMKIAIGSFENSYFGVLDSDNNIVENSSPPPFQYDYIGGLYRGNIFQTIIKSNEKHCKFVMMTLASDVFEIYEVIGNDINNVFVSQYTHIPRVHEKPRGNSIYAIDWDRSIAGLMKVAVSDELICFTYSDKSYTEAANAGKLSDEILCFDWNGNKVKKYILPFPISNFCIDNNYIYGTAYEGDDLCIYRFKMI